MSAEETVIEALQRHLHDEGPEMGFTIHTGIIIRFICVWPCIGGCGEHRRGQMDCVMPSGLPVTTLRVVCEERKNDAVEFFVHARLEMCEGCVEKFAAGKLRMN